MARKERCGPACAAQVARDPASHEQPVARRCGAFLEERLQLARRERDAPQVRLGLPRAGQRVPSAGPDDLLAVRGSDRALDAVELEADPALDDRPALLLARVPVLGQTTAGLDPAVDHEVLALRPERVTGAVNGI